MIFGRVLILLFINIEVRNAKTNESLLFNIATTLYVVLPDSTAWQALSKSPTARLQNRGRSRSEMD